MKWTLKVLMVFREKQAEKLKSRQMKEGWMKNDEGWMKNDEGWWFQAVEGFWWRTDGGFPTSTLFDDRV